MEEKKLKIDGERFQEVLQEELNELNGSLEKQLLLIKGKAKRNPLLNLYYSKRLNLEYVLEEMPKLMNKTSTLPSGEREVLRNIISKAINKTALDQAQAELDKANAKLEKKEKSTKSKTEKAKKE